MDKTRARKSPFASITNASAQSKILMLVILLLVVVIIVLFTSTMSRWTTNAVPEAMTMSPSSPVPAPSPSPIKDQYTLRVQNDKQLQAYLAQLHTLSAKADPGYCGSAGCFTPEIEALKKKMNAAGYVEIQYPIDCDANACGGAWAQKDWPEVAAYHAYKHKHPDPDSGSEPGLIEVQATRYNDEYKENEVAADAKYKGKALSLRGEITRIGKAVTGENFIGLRAGTYAEVAIYGVSTQEAIGLKRGQNVTVSCMGDGMTLQIATCKIPANTIQQ